MKKPSRFGMHFDVPIKTSINYNSIAKNILSSMDQGDLPQWEPEQKPRISNLSKWKNIKEYKKESEEFEAIFKKLFTGGK